MTEFPPLFGKVYILENIEANRVKVGMTINDVESRRIEVNQMWFGTRATCQVCGGRRLVKRINGQAIIPKHVVSSTACPGGNSLPLEKDSSLANDHLEKMKANHNKLIGNEMASNTRRINKLEERIKRFAALQEPVGIWIINTIYYTNSAEDVEKRVHKVLLEFVVNDMPLGEVFKCSVGDARKAVESVLDQLGLTSFSKKEIVKNEIM